MWSSEWGAIPRRVLLEAIRPACTLIPKSSSNVSSLVQLLLSDFSDGDPTVGTVPAEAQ